MRLKLHDRRAAHIDALSGINLSHRRGRIHRLPRSHRLRQELAVAARQRPDRAVGPAGRGARRAAAKARQDNEFGFVFQEPALLSWRTALRTSTFRLEIVDYPERERTARCEKLLDLVGLLPSRTTIRTNCPAA